jgi:hypothetical protein
MNQRRASKAWREFVQWGAKALPQSILSAEQDWDSPEWHCRVYAIELRRSVVQGATARCADAQRRHFTVLERKTKMV